MIDVEDQNMLMMQLANGTQATYMQCHYSPDAERNYTFIGTRGRIENIGDHGECKVHIWTKRGPRATPDIVYNLKPVTGTHGGADGPIIDNFLDFIVNGARTKPNRSPPVMRWQWVCSGTIQCATAMCRRMCRSSNRNCWSISPTISSKT